MVLKAQLFFSFIIILLIIGFTIKCDPESVQYIFQSGAEGYDTFRIPALIVSQNETVLAFAEGRKHSRTDMGDIDIVLKRSKDRGKTWSDLQIVWDDKENTCGNPAPVVDHVSGTIFLLCTWNHGADQESQIIDGKSKDTRRVFVLETDNDGKTWSQAKEITHNVKKENWTWYATGPGAGIQIERGKYKERLVVPCDHIEAGTRHYYSHIIYSDENGQNWKLGGRIPQHRVNECQVVELSDGRLMLNMRNYDRTRHMRQIAFSIDGGMTWTDQQFDSTLIEPICQASIHRYSWPGANTKNVILFSNPAHEEKRINMTVRASFDDGRTWPLEKVLYAGPSAYSDLAVLPHHKAFCLYERGEKHPYETIVLERSTIRDFGKGRRLDGPQQRKH
jgi:sialidase-1